MPTIAEASRQLSVSTDTIRRRIKAGVLEAKKKDGKWDVTLPDTPPEAAETPVQSFPGLERVIALLQEEIGELRRQLEAREREVGQLHILMGQRQLQDQATRKWWAPWRR